MLGIWGTKHVFREPMLWRTKGSHSLVLSAMLSTPVGNCVIVVHGCCSGGEECLRQIFQKASKDEDGGRCKFLCPTMVVVIAKVVGCELIQFCSVASTV